MRLTDLIPSYAGPVNPEITGLTADSRRVRPGFLFAALPGVKADGAVYIQDAIAKGAAAILTDISSSCAAGGGVTGRGPSSSNVQNALPPGPSPASRRGEVAMVSAENPRHALAQAAARFYGRQPDYVAAVTGTNGKTSVAHFTRQLWQKQGLKAASIGTLGVHADGIEKPGSLTTPDTVALHEQLAELAGAGITHLVMEASSHGLDQYRLDGMDVAAAGFTNLTLDHLDYHGTMEAYRAAKRRLFSDILRADGTAVLNADVPESEDFREAAGQGTVIDYGRMAKWLRLETLTPRPDGQDMTFTLQGKTCSVRLRLVGGFMAMNVLCALGFVIASLRGDMHAIHDLVPYLTELNGAPGRLQLVPGHNNRAVYVDYAHTPDALENVLKALRPHAQGQLLVVAGCGGDRDRSKRPVMGRIARDFADVTIITDDNPRSEDPAAIRAAMLEGAGPDALEIGDRREAIQAAVSLMKDGDVLVIAGKGHEQGQIVGGTTWPFDDVAEAGAAIRETGTMKHKGLAV